METPLENETEALTCRFQSALKLQSVMRGYLGRRLAAKLRGSRNTVARSSASILNDKKHRACLSFQTYVWRPYCARAIQSQTEGKEIQIANERDRCAINSMFLQIVLC